MFVFCSGLLVSLAFRVSCQLSRPSEIRWLNVKQPTSTRLRLDHDQDRTRSGSRSKLVMSESFVFCSSRFVSLASGIGHERVDLSSTELDPALSFRTHRRRRLWLSLERDQRLDHDQARSSSRVVASSTQSPTSGTVLSRVLSRLGDLSKRLARPELSALGVLALRPELRAFGQHSERS